MPRRLAEDERHGRQDIVPPTSDRRLRARGQPILMAARGRRHWPIAEALGIGVRTLQR
jgi:hypothetical protein